MAIIKDLGSVTPYAKAVEQGYTGTEAEWYQVQLAAAQNAQDAQTAAQSAAADAAAAAASKAEVTAEGATQVAAVQAKGTEVLNSIPSDYTALSEEVSSLSSALSNEVSNLKDDIDDLNTAVFDIVEASDNKFNSSLVTSATVSTDKKLYGNGTLRDATGIDVSPFMPIKPSTDYWMGLVPSYGNAGVPWYGQSVAIEFYSAPSESSQISRIDSVDNNAITFTSPASAMYYRFDIARSSGINFSVLNSRCMLVEGTTAPTEYVPYSEEIKTSKLIELQSEINDIDNRVDQFGASAKHHLSGTTRSGNVLIRNGTTVYDATGLFHAEYTNISNYTGETVYVSGKTNVVGDDGKAYVLYGFYDSNNALLLYHASTAATYYNDVSVTVPQGAVKLIVNGNDYRMPSVVVSDVIPTTNDIAYEKYDGDLYVSTKYGTGIINVIFGKRGPNQLPDFKKITIDGREKYNGSSDMHSPFTIKAVNNIDGDDVDNHTYTGGNHNYGNTGTTDYTATGRNVSLDIYADGKLLSNGEYGLATTITIKWVNRVQGYNTRKADGSGREIIEERHTIIFDGVNWVSTVELEPLEDVVIENYYGYQCPVSNYPNIHMIGADYKKEFAYTDPHNSGNSTPNVYIACSVDDRLEMEVDRSYDMGKGTYYTGAQGFRTISGGKGYAFLISNLSASSGDIYGARGTYRFIPNY